MKKQGKKFVLAGLVLLAVTGLLAMAGCENGSGSAGGNLPDAKLVVKESVAAMEQMMSESPTGQSPQTSQRLSSVLPNTAVDEKKLKEGVIGLAGVSMYMAEYLVENDVIDFDTTYKDYHNLEPDVTEFFCMERMEDGAIRLTKDMHYTEYGIAEQTEVLLYFYYDYELMEPSATVCVQFNAVKGGAMATRLDYQTKEAVLLKFEVEPDQFSTLWSALEEKSFGFDKLMENDVLLYEAASMTVDNGAVSNLKAYEYDSEPGGEGIQESISEEEVAGFFDEVYSKLKDSFAVRNELDPSTAEQKRFYTDMINYVGEKLGLL